jgi:hypothetical protein
MEEINMIIKPEVKLALSIYDQPGVYALLLGSGISRSAGIPTGWEITLDLIKRVSVLYGETLHTDYYRWYIEKFGEEPDYCKLLSELAKTPSERNSILRGYFEIANDEEETNYKKPTKAHKAIADMVKLGFIKVIVTTNFDRLLENALNEIGIVPDVISNIDQVSGVIPLIHSKCTIVKINGDYMDTRIKNTEDELSQYDPVLCELLDKVFDEFGLIICGWSGEWDIALRQCIYKCKNHRYSSYWLRRGALSEEAKRICEFRKADFIEISDADTFFDQLKDNLNSISDLTRMGNVLTRDLACAKLKRLLPEAKNIITVSDLINDVCKQSADSIKKLNWTEYPNSDTIKTKIESIEINYDVLLHLLTLGAYWGSKEYEIVWKNSFKNTFNINYINNGYNDWIGLTKYPSSLVLYVLLMSSMLIENYTFVYSMLNDIKCVNEYNNENNVSSLVYPSEIIDHQVCNKAISNGQDYYFPLSERMFTILEKPMEQIISKDEFTVLFDKVEFFYAANYCYSKAKDRNIPIEESWAPLGRFGYKMRYNSYFEKIFSKEIELKDHWSALKAGFFEGTFDTFMRCAALIKRFSSSLH